MRRLLAALALSVIWGTLTPAQAGPWRKLWNVSQYVTIGVNAADAHSSWGRPEANPVLGQRFGGRAVTIKAAVIGAWLLMQHRTNRSGEHSKAYAISNFAMSGALGAVAVHNYRMPR